MIPARSAKSSDRASLLVLVQPEPEPVQELAREPLQEPVRQLVFGVPAQEQEQEHEHEHEQEHEPVSEQAQESEPTPSTVAPLLRLAPALGFRSHASVSPSVVRTPPHPPGHRRGICSTTGCRHKQSVRTPPDIERCGIMLVCLRSHDQPEPWRINQQLEEAMR